MCQEEEIERNLRVHFLENLTAENVETGSENVVCSCLNKVSFEQGVKNVSERMRQSNGGLM